jgi:hypothetical protein
MYALGIYLLNLLVLFLSPQRKKFSNTICQFFIFFFFSFTPATDIKKKILNFAELDEEGPELPTKSGEEFRPFIRKLPEFKFW